MATKKKSIVQDSSVDNEIEALKKRQEELCVELSQVTQKLLFLKNEITVKPIGKKIYDVPSGKDDTEYLLSNKANRDHLMKSIKQLNKGKHQIRELID